MADDADAAITFNSVPVSVAADASSVVSSISESIANVNPLDFSVYIDQVGNPPNVLDCGSLIEYILGAIDSTSKLPS